MTELERKIVDAYVAGKTSLRDVAVACGTNHHRVKKILTAFNIDIIPKPNVFPEICRRAAALSRKGKPALNRGIPASKISRYKNMAAHLQHKTPIEWLMQFSDIDKLMYLNRLITRRQERYRIDEDTYKSIIIKFYDDRTFNRLYRNFKSETDKKKRYWMQPTFDHILPRSKGGKSTAENLRVLTWFENRARVDMGDEMWDYCINNLIGEKE